MYIINVVARVCSSPLPAPCPRNKARVIPDATKLIPPPHSLFDQITGNSHLNDGSSPGQRIGNLESLMQDPDGQERKLWPTTQGLWSFPTAASSPPRTPPHYRLVLIFTCQSIKCWIEETCWPIGYAIYGSILPLPLPPHYNHVGSCNLTCCLTCNVNVS